MTAIRYEFSASTHPENHYGRATLGISGRDVSFVCRTDIAWELRAILAHAYALGRRHAKREAIDVIASNVCERLP